MHSTSRVAYSSAESDDVKIDSLYLDGAAGKILATIDERMLSLEAKTGHALDIKIHSINRVHHHHTRLIPTSFAAIGLGLIWSGIRIFSQSTIQIATIIAGISLILGWATTRKPTLTIDTEVGDCHVITGNDFSLLKLNTILMRLQRGFGLHEAIDGLDILGGDAQYPRAVSNEENHTNGPAVEISRPESIASFLATDMVESADTEDSQPITLDAELFDFELPTEEKSETIPNWLNNNNNQQNQAPIISATDSLIQRGISNVGDRRGRQDNNQMSMFNPINVDLASVPIQNQTQASEEDLLAKSNKSSIEAGPSKLPELLPNFWNSDGYHKPEQQQINSVQTDYSAFSSPDSLLGNFDEYGEPLESLVASARKSHSTTKNNIPQDKQLLDSKATRLRKKTIPTNSRLVKKRKQKLASNGLASRLMPAAGRIGNSMRDAVNSISNRIINKLEENVQVSQSLRERSDVGMEMELETYRNLAESNGGPLSDEKVKELEENARRRKALVEQNQQELEDNDKQLSFKDLIDTESHNAAKSGKSNLPRIDL